MQVVIDIDDNLYTRLFDNGVDNYDDAVDMAKAIRRGAILPKGHGRLIDVSDLTPDADYEDGIFYAVSVGQIENAPTIIEADNEPCDDYDASYCEQRDCAECEYNLHI